MMMKFLMMDKNLLLHRSLSILKTIKQNVKLPSLLSVTSYFYLIRIEKRQAKKAVPPNG
jgi:hypothetical protein